MDAHDPTMTSSGGQRSSSTVNSSNLYQSTSHSPWKGVIKTNENYSINSIPVTRGLLIREEIETLVASLEKGLKEGPRKQTGPEQFIMWLLFFATVALLVWVMIQIKRVYTAEL